MSRLTLRVLAVTAAALLAGYGCSADGMPTGSSATAPLARYEKLHAPATTLAPRFGVSGKTEESRVIDPRGGVLEVGGGYRLVFPAGAVSEPTRITMTAHPEYVGVELEPHGLQFPEGREPVLTLSIRGVDVSGYRTLSIVYVDDAETIREVLPTQTVGAASVTARLRHFSGYLTTGNRSDTP